MRYVTRHHRLKRPQLEAIKKLWTRSHDGETSYRMFRSRFYDSRMNGCVMGTWCGMTVGIEDDGHTHT